MFLMTTPFGSLKLTSLTWLQSCQPWSYWRLVAYSFLRDEGEEIPQSDTTALVLLGHSIEAKLSHEASS
jgi:hypothetical protein